MVQAPTGSGKSVIAVAAGLSALDWYSGNKQHVPSGVCIATPQKMLQDQYEDLFRVTTLKGRSNYQCIGAAKKSRSGKILKLPTAKECVLPLMTTMAARNSFYAATCHPCPYQEKVKALSNADGKRPIVLNFSTLLYHQAYTANTTRIGVLVVDEAHGVEDALRDFFTLELKNDEFHTLGGDYKLEDVAGVQAYLTAAREELEEEDAESGEKDWDVLRAIAEIKRWEYLLTFDNAGWLLTERVVGKDGDPTRVVVKPKYVAPLANVALPRGQYAVRIYLSATLSMHQFCRTMGLDPSKVGKVSIPSDFPVARRPILRDTVGSMSKSNKDATLPGVHKKLMELLDQYTQVRVLVHAVSGELAEDLYKGFTRTHRYRAILHTGGDKTAALAKFSELMPGNQVLISPSVSEGFDGKDGLCRVNIIPKVSFAYLGDPVVAALAAEDPVWYAETAARTIVQQYGRAMRHKDDYGITYILDEDFNRLYTHHRKLFPKWFQDAVAVGDKKLGIKDRRALI